MISKRLIILCCAPVYAPAHQALLTVEVDGREFTKEMLANSPSDLAFFLYVLDWHVSVDYLQKNSSKPTSRDDVLHLLHQETMVIHSHKCQRALRELRCCSEGDSCFVSGTSSGLSTRIPQDKMIFLINASIIQIHQLIPDLLKNHAHLIAELGKAHESTERLYTRKREIGFISCI